VESGSPTRSSTTPEAFVIRGGACVTKDGNAGGGVSAAADVGRNSGPECTKRSVRKHDRYEHTGVVA
jgi:hypothetical protein